MEFNSIADLRSLSLLYPILLAIFRYIVSHPLIAQTNLKLADLVINYVHKIGPLHVGGSSPVRVMGILNASPESFYKKSVKKGTQIAQTVLKMEQDGADFVDIGGMSTAPYLSTIIPEKHEIKRVLDAIKQIRQVSDIPLSVDTCRANVAKEALASGVQILNDISGLKYDKQMASVVERYSPSLILCAYGKNTIRGNLLEQTKILLKQSLHIARRVGVENQNIALDPAVGFFRNKAKGKFYTKITSDWLARDLDVIANLSSLKMGQPILISVSNKSFIGRIIESKDPEDRLLGSLTAEAIATINGADIIRTHNVGQTKTVISLAQKMSKKTGKGL
ncbi:dihydropteroate synthase [Candidatus Nitrosotenuis uzonensis]|uniref:dihydropteroate synthase n=1 Tax=Candidatus Nitrosotenuis uzonensis TaxID=1407055 RepID=A0A812F628_9ARCH|nr:dihydropteroate synthase [Candidatus Nitrosotenuis uzonensis]CAE6493170.1 Dihydropteroate synthase [Candidatus Nitrosotenuis uzonensis]